MTDQDYNHKDFYQSIDTTLMGARTFRQILSWGDFPYADKCNYVFTRHQPLTDTSKVHGITQDGINAIRQLKAQVGH